MLKIFHYAFPELDHKTQNTLVFRIMLDQGIGLLETISGWFKNPADLKDRLTVEGLELIQQAQAENKGVLLVGCHFTTLDFAGTLFTNYSNMDVVYRKNNNPVLDYYLTKARSRYGDPIEKKELKKLIRRLKSGHVVWYAPDQDYGSKNAVFVPFFGVQTATITATSTIAKITKASVFMIRHYREDKGRHYRIEIVPVSEFPSDNLEEDTTRINGLIEEGIRKAPEQYMWVHRRFKHRPDGEKFLY